jgi:glycerophosphoryl diester phosphodiesterase
MTTTAAARLNAFYHDLTRPAVVAHRGAMAYAPMNTLAAFELAVEQGADGIELDVWLCQDDIPVVMHDFGVDKTTDGEGRLGSMPLEEIKALDAGSWFSEEYAGQEVPTLDEVFEAVGHKVWINVEIKSLQIQNQNVAWQVSQVIDRHNMHERVIVSSFNPWVLRQMRKLAPDIPLGYLDAIEIKRYAKLLLIGLDFQAWHPEDVQVTPEAVARAHSRGRRVSTWTVNDVDDAIRMRDAGVDAIITDNPDKLLAAFSEGQGASASSG